MLEIWKEIIGYSGIYVVNPQGKIKSLRTKKIMRTHKNPLGYEFVRLSLSGKSKKHRVHRIVAKAFLDNPFNKPFINHLDSNPSNNHMDNLTWCTQAENIQYAYDYGNKKPTLNRIGCKQGSTSKYANVYFDKARNRWIANVDFTNVEGKFKKRRFFSVSRFKSSEQAEKAAAYAVNIILDEIKDTSRTRNLILLTDTGQYEDAPIKTLTN